MDRRRFLKGAFGVAAASAATVAAARAAPFMPQPVADKVPDKDQAPQHALANDADVNEAQIEQVRWGRGRGWGRRRRRYWHRRRYWGWRRRRVYRRRYWRRRYW